MLEIKVLGSGCKNCTKLYDEVNKLIKELGVEANVIKEESIQEIMRYGVMRTPGLVINEQVKSSGKVPKSAEIEKYIREEM